MLPPPPASFARSRSSTPPGTIVDARPPAAVAGGNVETSQRIVDVLLRALAQAAPERVPAASAGTMSNLTIGGIDPRTGAALHLLRDHRRRHGRAARRDGISGVQTHMTNSLNTPVEALEFAYPFRVRRYAYRAGSGGAGQFRGGDGLVREIELLADAQVTLLADRRTLGPTAWQAEQRAQRAAQSSPLRMECKPNCPAKAACMPKPARCCGWRLQAVVAGVQLSEAVD